MSPAPSSVIDARAQALILDRIKRLAISMGNVQSVIERKQELSADEKAQVRMLDGWRRMAFECVELLLASAVPAPPEKECRKCHQVEAAHCDFDEPGLDHAETCMKLHHQFVAITRGDQSDPSFFRTLEKWLRVDDPDGGEIIVIQFAEGGTVNVLTEKPLLFIEPERH